MKKIIALTLVLIMALSLCACGTAAQQPATPAENTAEPPAAETQASETGTETAPAPAEDIVVTDLMGRTVTIPAGAEKFACIGPGTLRLYCYVADIHALVGVEEVEKSWGDDGRPYRMGMDNIDELPVIGPGGPGNAPDAEMLYTAAPDVIFTGYTSDTATVDELQDKTGIPVVAISYGKSELFDPEVYETFTLIGKITGNEDRAAAVIQYFEDAKSDLIARTADVSERARVYLGGQSNRGSHGIESTTGGYILFDVVNALDVVEEESGITQYVMLDKEALLELDPDYIILDAGGLNLVRDDYAANPDFYNSLSAVKNGKVYLQMPYNYYYTNLEIALADAYYIGAMLYPEAFSDVDPVAKFDEISTFLVGVPSYERIAANYFGGYQQVELG